MSISPELIELLVAEREVRNVELRYGRSIDRLDIDAIRSCYWPEATEDHGEYHGSIDGFIGFVEEFLSNCESSQHFVGNMLIDIQGEKALCEAYYHAYLRFRDGAGSLINRHQCARFYDRFEQRDGVWRIIERRFIRDWALSLPVGEGMWQSMWGVPASEDRAKYRPANAGVTGPQDPSMAVIAAWRSETASNMF